MSPLKALLAANSARFTKGASPYRAAIEPGENLTDSALEKLCLGIAEPYLALRWEFSQNLPVIHDSWLENEQAVLLLEDCSHWPLLIDGGVNPKLPPSKFYTGCTK